MQPSLGVTRLAMLRWSVTLVLAALCTLSQGRAATITWVAPAPANWDTTSLNWLNGAITTNYSEGDNVRFDSEAYPGSCGTNTIQAGGVTPGSILITGQRAPIGWTFLGGDILGATSLVHDWGNRDMTFAGGDANGNYNFGGGVYLQSTPSSSGATMIYTPGSNPVVDTHYFGTGDIHLSWRNSGFRFSPLDAGDHLSNNFVVNGGAWRAPSNGGILDGTVTLAGDLYFSSQSRFNPADSTVITNAFLLTTDPTIRHLAPIVGNGFKIDGPIVSSGAKRDLTLLEDGDNYAWYMFLGDNGGANPPMDVKNLILTNTPARWGTIQIDADERTYFSQLAPNGGGMILGGGTSVRFFRASAIEVGFPMDVRAGNVGFQLNDTINVNSGGYLGGGGNFGRSTGIYSADYTNPMTININNGGIMEIGNGAIYRGPVIVKNGGMLQGAGPATFSQGLTLAGTVSPGNSVGLMAVTGSATLQTNGVYVWEINDAGGSAGSSPGWDLLSVSGVLSNLATAANPFTIQVLPDGEPAGFDPSVTYAFPIATSDVTIVGFSADAFVTDGSAFTAAGRSWNFTVSQSGNSLLLNASAVPEPSTLLLLVVGGLLGWRFASRPRQ